LLALFIAFLNLTSFSVPYIRTVIFAGLSTSALLYVFSCRSFRRSILQINFFSNKILLGAVGLGFGLLLLGVYEPHLQVILDTTPLKAIHWPLIIGLGLIKLLAVEVCKYYFNVKRKSAAAPATA
jgi:Ca2+-transporting ATPase